MRAGNNLSVHGASVNNLRATGDLRDKVAAAAADDFAAAAQEQVFHGAARLHQHRTGRHGDGIGKAEHVLLAAVDLLVVNVAAGADDLGAAAQHSAINAAGGADNLGAAALRRVFG